MEAMLLMGITFITIVGMMAVVMISNDINGD